MKPLTLVVAVSLVACGSKTSGTGGSTSSSTSTHASASSTSTGSQGCAKPGDMGNTQGVGAFCTPGGGECNKFPMAGLCLADVGEPENFCTRIGCKTAADCGAGAGCHLDPAGSACVPCSCDNTAVGCGGTSTSTSSSSGSTSSSSSSSTGNSSSSSASSSASGG